MPIVLMLIVTVLVGASGDQWDIGLIVEGDGPAAQEFARTIATLESGITSYYRIITRDPATAQALVNAGRLHMVITIPSTFDERLAAGAPPTIEAQVFNINTDMTKNVRLRLQAAIQSFQAQRGMAPVTVERITTRDTDVWRRAFIAGGAVVVALLVGASLNTALMVAREWERNTVKTLRLAPGALPAIITGKLLAGLTAAVVNVTRALAVAVVLFGLRIPLDRCLPLLSIGLGVAVTAAGLGLGIGALCRDYRTVQPLLLVTAAGSFFASGGYASVATLPPVVRTLNVFWPPAYVFEAMQRTMYSATLPDLTNLLLTLPLTSALGVAVGWGLLRQTL
jgi:ABC-type polysaccharide/polyol phosphate export permease